MGTDPSGKKPDNGELREVIYTSTDSEKNEPTLLKSVPCDSIFLYISAFTADMIIFTCGASFAWSSPVFPKLKEVDPNINPLGQVITPLQESWVAALVCLGAAVGPLAAGKFADGIGRKKTLLLLSVPMLLAYLTLTFATNMELYYIARFVLGIGVGGTFAVLPMYLGEITEDHNRGKFGCLMTVVLTLGLLYPFVVGPLLSIKVFSFSCAIALMLFLIFFSIFIPESPVYLVSIGNKKVAREALSKLRNKSDSQVEKELAQIIKTIEQESGDGGGIGDLFKSVNLRTGVTVVVGLLILQQFSGINAIIAFLGPIFEAAGSSISSYTSTIIVGTIQVFSTLLTAVVVESLGRKILLMISTIGSCASILLLGLYFYLKKNELYNVDSISWLPVLCLIVYIVTFNIGLGPLPWAIMAEIFPPHAKSNAAALASFSGFLASFSVTLGFPIILEYVGIAQCFWWFGSCCFLGIVFIHCIVPETKGKTLAEIQQLLGKR